MADYLAALKKDLVEQFKGKPNIEALLEVISIELQQVHDFYVQLRDNRDVLSAVGKQLDGAGDIVVLSRMEAGILTGDPIPFEVMEDDLYRRYLIFKILKNTCSCTYPDIIKAFQMFWDKPLYFREDLNEPATMIFDTGELTADINVLPLVTVPLLRAAGVTLKLMIWIKCRTHVTLHVGGGVGANAKIGLPEGEDHFDFQDSLHPGEWMGTHEEFGVPEGNDSFAFTGAVNAGAAPAGGTTVLSVPEYPRPPDRVSILRTGGVFTIIAPSAAPGEIEQEV